MRHEFNATAEQLDVRFVIQAPTTVWIDDVSVEPLKAGSSDFMRLRAEGVQIRNRVVQSDVESKQMHRDFEAWEQNVIREMMKARVPPSDFGFFETLDVFVPVSLPGAYDERHAKDLRELTEKLRRLLEIAQRYDRRL